MQQTTLICNRRRNENLSSSSKTTVPSINSCPTQTKCPNMFTVSHLNKGTSASPLIYAAAKAELRILWLLKSRILAKVRTLHYRTNRQKTVLQRAAACNNNIVCLSTVKITDKPACDNKEHISRRKYAVQAFKNKDFNLVKQT